MPNDETTQTETDSLNPRYTSAYGIGKRAFVSGTHEPAPEPRPGDVHLDRSAPAERQYLMLVPNQPLDDPEGARGDRTLRVTHIYTAEDDWRPIDNSKLHMVLQVRASDSQHDLDGLPWAAMRAIEFALRMTPAGQILGDRAIRTMTESVMSALGIPEDSHDNETWDRLGVIDGDGLEKVRRTITELLSFTPESGYLPELGEMGAAHDDIGFAEDADEYNKLLSGESDGFGGSGDGLVAPLLSQAVYYAILGGKHDGRSVNARITAVREAAGVTDGE